MTTRTSSPVLDFEADFRLGDVLVRPHASTLKVAGSPRRVDYKAMRVLLCLARRAGREVTKEQIFSEVWDGSAVSDDVLTGAVSTLRRALGDDPRAPRYIQTIPRVGYRLIASVEPLARSPGVSTEAAGETPARRWLIPILALVGLMLGLALVGWWMDLHDGPVPHRPTIRSLVVLPLANFTGDDGREHLADGMTEALIRRLGENVGFAGHLPHLGHALQGD